MVVWRGDGFLYIIFLWNKLSCYLQKPLLVSFLGWDMVSSSWEKPFWEQLIDVTEKLDIWMATAKVMGGKSLPPSR